MCCPGPANKPQSSLALPLSPSSCCFLHINLHFSRFTLITLRYPSSSHHSTQLSFSVFFPSAYPTQPNSKPSIAAFSSNAALPSRLPSEIRSCHSIFFSLCCSSRYRCLFLLPSRPAHAQPQTSPRCSSLSHRSPATNTHLHSSRSCLTPPTQQKLFLFSSHSTSFSSAALACKILSILAAYSSLSLPGSSTPPQTYNCKQ